MATKSKDATAFFSDLQAAFPMNEAAFKDGYKQWASFNEKLSGIVLDAAGKSAEIYEQATKDAISLLRDATKAREDIADYASAANDLGTAQVELTRKNVEAFGEVVQKASGETTELFAEAGKQFADTAANTTETAQNKTAGAARKAATAN